MTHSPWTLVVAVMITGFLVVAQIYAVLPLLGTLGVDLGITETQADLIPAAFGLAYAIGFLVFGPLADKADRMTLLIAGLVALAGTTALVAVAGDYAALVAARMLQGLAAASFPATALALVSQRVPRPDQPMAIAMMGFAFLSSAPLSQLLVAAFDLPLDRLMWGMAALYLICACGVLASGAMGPRLTDVAAEHPTLPAGGAAGRMLPPLAACVLAPLVVLFCLVSFHALCQLLAAPGSGADGVIDPQMLRLAGFPPLLLCFIAPRLTQTYGPAITACSGLAVTAAGLIVALVTSGGAASIAGWPAWVSAAGLVLASVVVSAGVALAVPGLIAAVTFWSGNAVRARALATYTFFLFIGAGTAPVVAGAAYRAVPAMAFAVPAIAALIACALLLRARPDSDPDSDPVRAATAPLP